MARTNSVRAVREAKENPIPQEVKEAVQPPNPPPQVAQSIPPRGFDEAQLQALVKAQMEPGLKGLGASLQEVEATLANLKEQSQRHQVNASKQAMDSKADLKITAAKLEKMINKKPDKEELVTVLNRVDNAIHAVDRNTRESQDLSKALNEFMERIDGEMKSKVDSKALLEKAGWEEVNALLKQITHTLNDKLTRSTKDVKELKNKIVDPRSGAGLQKCISCSRQMPDPQQVLYWSAPTVDPALEIGVDHHVYKITREAQMQAEAEAAKAHSALPNIDNTKRTKSSEDYTLPGSRHTAATMGTARSGAKTAPRLKSGETMLTTPHSQYSQHNQGQLVEWGPPLEKDEYL